MIDLALQATTQAAILTRLTALNLLATVTDEFGATAYMPAPGFDYCWWAGSGKLMTAAPVLDGQGGVTTPATFLAGFVMLARITDPDDALPGAEGSEQWFRSEVAQTIKANGTATTIAGFPCVTQSGVRMIAPDDLFDWLATNNLPGHEWSGGNSL